MTMVSIDMPDELIARAKRQGVFNEQDFTQVLSEFLSQQLANTQPTLAVRQLGTMAGKISVPNDFDHAYADDIEQLFNGS